MQGVTPKAKDVDSSKDHRLLETLLPVLAALGEGTGV